MNRAGALDRLAGARTGHLATVTADGTPHIVVVTFAVVADSVVTAVDHKPKTTNWLKRVANIEHNGRASFLVDYYSEDWNSLWWVRVDGSASILTSGGHFDDALDALVARYDQYNARRPEGPVIAIGLDRVTGWQA